MDTSGIMLNPASYVLISKEDESNMLNYMPNTFATSRPFTDEEIKSELLKTLEYYFSSKNLSKDQYLVSQMDNEAYVFIAEIAKFNKIKNLTNDLELIKSIIRRSTQLQLDPTQTKLRSINGVAGGIITVKSGKPPVSQSTEAIGETKQKCILILREVSPKATEDKLKELFTDKEPKCPMYVDCEAAGNDSWYVSFSNEEQAQRALQYLKTEIQVFMEKPIRARIKHVIPRSSTANNTSAILNTSLNTTLGSTPSSTPPPPPSSATPQAQAQPSPLVTSIAQPAQYAVPQVYTTVPAQLYQQYHPGSTSSPLSPNQYYMPVAAPPPPSQNRFVPQTQPNAYVIQNEAYTQQQDWNQPQQNQYWNRNIISDETKLLEAEQQLKSGSSSKLQDMADNKLHNNHKQAELNEQKEMSEPVAQPQLAISVGGLPAGVLVAAGSNYNQQYHNVNLASHLQSPLPAQPQQFLNNNNNNSNSNAQFKGYYGSAASPSLINQQPQQQQQPQQYQIYSHIPSYDPNQVLPPGAILTTNLGQYQSHFVIAPQQQQQQQPTNGNNNNGGSSAEQLHYPNSYIISTSGGQPPPPANPNMFNAYQQYAAAAAYNNLNQQQPNNAANIYQTNSQAVVQHQHNNNNNYQAHFKPHHNQQHHHHQQQQQQQSFNANNNNNSAQQQIPPNAIPIAALQGANIYYDLVHSADGSSSSQPITIMMTGPANKNQLNETQGDKSAAKTPVPSGGAAPPPAVQTIQVPIGLPLLTTTTTVAAAAAAANSTNAQQPQQQQQQQPALLFYNNGMQHPILLNPAVVAAATAGQQPNSISLMPAPNAQPQSQQQQTPGNSASPLNQQQQQQQFAQNNHHPHQHHNQNYYTNNHHQQQQQHHHNSHHHHQQQHAHMQPVAPHRRNLAVNNANSESRSSSGSNHYHATQNQRSYANNNYSTRPNKYHANGNSNAPGSPSPSSMPHVNYQLQQYHTNNYNNSHQQHHHQQQQHQTAQYASVANSVHSDSNTSSGISSTSNTPIHINSTSDNYDLAETNSNASSSRSAGLSNKSPPINSDLVSFPPLSSNKASKDALPVSNNNNSQKQAGEASSGDLMSVPMPIDPAIISISKSADSIPDSPTIIKSANLGNNSLANILTLAQQSANQASQEVSNVYAENIANNKSNGVSSMPNRQHQQKNDYSRNANNNNNNSNNRNNYRSPYNPNKKGNEPSYSASSSPSPTFSKNNSTRINNNSNNNNRQTNSNTHFNSEQTKSQHLAHIENAKSQNEPKQSSEQINDAKTSDISPLNKIPSTSSSSSSSSSLSTTLIAGTSSSSSLLAPNHLNLNDLTLTANSKAANSTHSSTSSIPSLQNEEDLVNSLNNCWNKKLTFAEVLQKPITPSSGGISVSTSSSSISEAKTKSNEQDGLDESNMNPDLDESNTRIGQHHQQSSPTTEPNIIMQIASSNPSTVLAAD